MMDADTAMRTAGGWLAVASALLAGVLVAHGPIHPELSGQMEVIANDSTRWAIVHWAAAASLSLFAVTGLIVLTARSRLTDRWWTLSAWGLVTVGALWTVTTAVAEATAMAGAAAAADLARYDLWRAFSEGKASGFVVLALAVATIAANELRSTEAATPAWASSIAVLAGTLSATGWALGMWFGFAPGSMLWVAASLVMCGWTLWFGLGLMWSKSVEQSPEGALRAN